MTEPRMFECVQFAHPCRMPVAACIARQKRVEKFVRTGRGVWSLPISFEKCVDCAQGEGFLKDQKVQEVEKVQVDHEMEAKEMEDQAVYEAPAPEMKACKLCGETKPLSEFVKSKACKGGVEGKCKACKRRLYHENYETVPRGIKIPPPIEIKPVSGPSALERQVGGDHYKGFAIQPVEFITRNNLGFLQGSVIKRICRYNQPGGKGREDLEKIIHEAQLLMEMA